MSIYIKRIYISMFMLLLWIDFYLYSFILDMFIISIKHIINAYSILLHKIVNKCI